MHGRTVTKEIDPGRYLRWVRAGIVACAVDLPGHGERFEARLQTPEATLEVVEQMVQEIDGVTEALRAHLLHEGPAGAGDSAPRLSLGIGGMSAGGMVAMARLCRRHPFVAASVEASTGSWRRQSHRAMWDQARADRLDPIEHLESWREIPFQAIHARHDEWVNVDGQREFIESLRARAAQPGQIEFEVFEERTGAPFEHAGFGRFGAKAKDLQTQFWQRRLGPMPAADHPTPAPPRALGA